MRPLWIARTLPMEVSSLKWRTTERTCAPKKSKPKSGLISMNSKVASLGWTRKLVGCAKAGTIATGTKSTC